MEEVLIQRAVKKIIQALYVNGLFDSFPNADEVLKDVLFVTRCRGDLEEKTYCRSMILFVNINLRKQHQIKK